MPRVRSTATLIVISAVAYWFVRDRNYWRGFRRGVLSEHELWCDSSTCGLWPGEPMTRPEIGSVTRYTLKIAVCRNCGKVVGDTWLCSDDCPFDGELRTAENTFAAVYERVETFLGDEAYPE